MGMLSVILGLAWPTMLEQLLQTAVQYIDAAMVGRLGAEATAAVGVTTTVSWLLNGTVMALGVGFLFFIAREYGAGNKKRAAQASSQAVLVALVSGTVFTILPLLLYKKIPEPKLNSWFHIVRIYFTGTCFLQHSLLFYCPQSSLRNRSGSITGIAVSL
mgnify:CR=1 FL=1